MNTDKPWVIVFNWNDPLGRIYLDEEEHRMVFSAIVAGEEQLSFNGRILPLRFAMLRENPDYVDQKKVERVREAVEKARVERIKKYGS